MSEMYLGFGYPYGKHEHEHYRVLLRGYPHLLPAQDRILRGQPVYG